MDITPRVNVGKVTIDTYGSNAFKAQGTRIEGPVLLFPDRMESWSGEMTIAGLQPFLDMADVLDVVLVGCGDKMQFLPKDVRQAFEAAGIGIDPMDTGAACRTFNILQIEERRVAAALINVE